MKKKMICAVLAALLTLLPCWSALGESGSVYDAPMYEANAAITFNIRSAPESAYRLMEVPSYGTVSVYEYQDGWYRVSYKKVMGWAKETWLWAFRSLDAMHYQVPGYRPEAGILTLTKNTWVEGGKYKGMYAAAGTVLTVASASGGDYVLHVWRGEGTVSAAAGEFTPFVPWQEAQPGDLISGFTSYYYERQGYPLHEERQYNIALGCKYINGAVVEPNAFFSFNAYCAPYLSGKGYKIAKNISQEGTGWGGGVCQVTTTLFDAVLGLPLQITDWDTHQHTGVDYVPISFDAAVGNSGDFMFLNTLGYPIRIWAQPQDGAVTVLIYRA